MTESTSHSAPLSPGWLAGFSQDADGPFVWDKSDRPLVVEAVAHLTGRPASEVDPLVEADYPGNGLWLIPLTADQLTYLLNRFEVKVVGGGTVHIEVELP